MKTLAVLSALATIAIAAPALEQYGDNARFASNYFTITQKREKKSTSEETLSEHSEDHASPKISNKFGSGASVARTFSGFKKPIIVKKKIGYHVYRDSDEEQAQADSRESCKKQIKVKLCDDNNSVDKMKSASIHHTDEEISENEMKHSINMAKEAVETFQRDLQKMEHDSLENNGQTHTAIGANKELREDIEKARQALEHIQRKFRKIDTDTVLTSEGISDTHLKTDEERMAQWKETVGSHKSFEIARNLEDNFKVTDKIDTPNDFKTSNLNGNTVKSIEDVDVRGSSQMNENKNEDDIISVVDKTPNMKIHSDSLKKEILDNEDDHEKEKRLISIEKNVENHNDIGVKTTDTMSANIEHSQVKSSAECNDHDHKNHQHKITGVQEDKEISNDEKLKSTPSEKSNMKTQDDLTWKKLKNIDILKSSVDRPVSDMVNHMEAVKNDHTTQESKLETSSTSNQEMARFEKAVVENEKNPSKTEKHKENVNHHENVEQRSTTLKQSATLPGATDHNQNSNDKQINLQRSSEKPIAPIAKSIKQTLLDNEENAHKALRTDMDSAKSSLSTTVTKLDNEQSRLRNHMDEHHENNNHQISSDTRATSDFPKNLLNNMEFSEDLHQSSFDKHSPLEAGHKLNKEKPELHERFNIPHVHPNTNHLKNMMDLSDNSQDHINQRTQFKMATMFNNEQPNVNVQFNSPQTFEQQTNLQRLMPFKAADEFHDEHSHNLDINTMHNKGEILSDLHDPLQIRWAHENHLQNIKAASHQDHMEMDGSSPHFSIDRSMPLRSSSMDGHHIGLNEQMKAHQRWMQEKNVNAYKTVTANTGLALQNVQRNDNTQFPSGMSQATHNFEQLHDHGNLNIMHGKSNMNTGVQLNNLMHMRGASKMALEYADPNQWTHNHGAFRSSYGPASYGSSSYGSGGSSASGSPTVGLFPNANVGNCAVPLLLSCSPSVVSGSLAKTNSYSAPSYRSEDLNFLKKRDTDIVAGNPGLKLNLEKKY